MIAACLSSNPPMSTIAIVFHLKLPQQQPSKASEAIKDTAKHLAGRYHTGGQ